MTTRRGGIRLDSRKGKRQGPKLQCYRCLRRAHQKDDATRIRATGSTQYLMARGRKRKHHDLVCAHGHRWWSCHPSARTLDTIAESELRALDQARES